MRITQPSNPRLAASPVGGKTPIALPTMVHTYQVESGDTLRNLNVRFYGNPNDTRIADANHISSVYQGQVIVIP